MAKPRSTAFSDYDDPFDAFVAAVNQTTGFSSEARKSFRTFLNEGRFEIDGRIILPDNNPWLAPLYDLTREDFLSGRLESGMVVFKPAQVGATVAILLLLLWLCLGEEGLQIGFFFPNKSRLEKMVKTRFNPLLRHPKIQGYCDGDVNTLAEKKIHKSTLHFIYTDGDGAVDSIPLNVGFYDEVRLMSEFIVEQSQYRYSGQEEVVAKIYASTAGAPGDLMDNMFRKSTQERWHSKCPNCNCRSSVSEDGKVDSRYDDTGFDAPEGLPLASLEPGDFIRPIDDDFEFFCKHTREVIDPLQGRLEAHAKKTKSKPFRGIHFGAFLRPITTAAKVWNLFINSKNKKEFWNGTMARATIEAAGAMLDVAHTDAARSLGRTRGLTWSAKECPDTLYGGVDQRTEELHVVVGTQSDIKHVQVIQGEAMWSDLEILMKDLGVHKYAIDYGPATSQALAYARRNSAAYLALYRPGHIVRKRKDQDDADVADDVREMAMILLDQVKSFKWAMEEFKDAVKPPDHAGNRIGIGVPDMPLVQYNFLDRRRDAHLEFDILEEFLDHMRNVAVLHRQKTAKMPGNPVATPITGQFVEEIGQVNFDPHFAHAYVYYRMCVHLQTQGGTYTSARAERLLHPDAPPTQYGQIKQKDSLTCGNCTWFRPLLGGCAARRIRGLTAATPKCSIPLLYAPLPSAK